MARQAHEGASVLSASERARRDFVCPRARGEYDGIELEHLDPAAPHDRTVLIESEHPELHRALRRGDSEAVIGGQLMNPRLHIAMHEIVANQIWGDDPPEAWETAQRLIALGYERHEVLHMLCSVVAREIWNVMGAAVASDRARYISALAELPESYFALADEP